MKTNMHVSCPCCATLLFRNLTNQMLPARCFSYLPFSAVLSQHLSASDEMSGYLYTFKIQVQLIMSVCFFIFFFFSQQKCTYSLTLLMVFLRSSSTYRFLGVATLGNSQLAVWWHHPVHLTQKVILLARSHRVETGILWMRWRGLNRWELYYKARVRSSYLGVLRRKNCIPPSSLSLISKTKDMISSKEQE